MFVAYTSHGAENGSPVHQDAYALNLCVSVVESVGHMGVAQKKDTGVTQVFVFVSICQGACLEIPYFELQPHVESVALT